LFGGCGIWWPSMAHPIVPVVQALSKPPKPILPRAICRLVWVCKVLFRALLAGRHDSSTTQVLKYLPGAREVQAARFIFGNPVSPSTLTKHTCISLPLATNCALVPAPRDGAMGPPACPSDPITRERPRELHIFSLRHKAIPTAYTQQCRVCRHGNNLFDSRHRRHSRPPVVEDAKNVNLPQLSNVEC
jgi:hypothetical protein